MWNALPSRFRKTLLVASLLIFSPLIALTHIFVVPVAAVLLFFYFKRG
jgi:hypothetical protein